MGKQDEVAGMGKQDVVPNNETSHPGAPKWEDTVPKTRYPADEGATDGLVHGPSAWAEAIAPRPKEAPNGAQWFRRRPSGVWAVQLESVVQVKHAFPDCCIYTRGNGKYRLETQHGFVDLGRGDWVVKDAANTYYPVAASLFPEIYEAVQESLFG